MTAEYSDLLQHLPDSNLVPEFGGVNPVATNQHIQPEPSTNTVVGIYEDIDRRKSATRRHEQMASLLIKDEVEVLDSKQESTLTTVTTLQPADMVDVAPTTEPIFIDYRHPFEKEPSEFSRYRHVKFPEQDNLDLARISWQIHAEGYQSMGFVNEGAVTADGVLTHEIDKARGNHVDYFLALNDENEGDRAAMRKINLNEGQTYKDLPAHKICEPSLSDLGVSLLEALHENGRQIKELGALSRTKGAHPLAVHEIFREVIHDSMGKRETFLLSTVSTTHDSLVKSFGEANFVVIGEDVPLNDVRVNSGIALRPSLVNPDTFIENIMCDYLYAESPTARARLCRSFMFFTDNLEASLLTDEMKKVREEILNIDAANKKVGV